MTTRRRTARNTPQDWLVGSAALGVVTSGMALAHAPDLIADPSLTLPNLLTAGWAFGATFLMAKIVTKIESKVRARFAPSVKPQSGVQKQPRKTKPKAAPVLEPVASAAAEPVFDEGSAFAGPRRQRPPRRKVHTSDEAWLRHLKRSAAAVRISNKPEKPSAFHGIHRPFDFDEDISDIGRGPAGLAA